MMISKKIKYHLKNIMSTGLPLWNNKEKFTSTTPAGTGSPATGDPFAEARSSLSTNDASLQSAKGLVNSIDGSLNQLKEALGGMNLENLLNGLGGIQNGVGDLRTLINLGKDRFGLVTNFRSDNLTFHNWPNSVIFKLYPR